MDNKLEGQPNAMSTLSTWLCYLEQLHHRPIELGLARIEQVAYTLEVLKPAPYVITVAGTNGKGTTCRMLEMILINAGYQVGVYSSPHLIHYRERVRINNAYLSDEMHVKAFELIEQARNDISLTYFEYSTLAALLLFKQAQLDVIILEVGLGGRLDATNIVESDLSVITSIALDHTDWLGDNRESIGREKAGIFRFNHPAIVGEPDMPKSIVDYAKLLDSTLYTCEPNPGASWSYTIADDSWSFDADRRHYRNLPLPHIPIANAATAIATLLYSALSFDERSLRAALESTTLQGRMQIIAHDPLVILDVAHNPHASNYLNEQLQRLRKKQHSDGVLRMVVGMLKDKDIESTLSKLNADYWYCGSLQGQRGAPAEKLAQYLPTEKTKQFSCVVDAWQCAQSEASKNDIIVICGSFHTVAQVMEYLGYE
ncbi:bifunctional tetrahydrofolate synthase/dihydrofolate synthase [Utexia brackfieldae]|uniref:bifunctional tetrahydrofolate synthase/dihydrofolate synthase n=1 Tax=Utexia brackfieldae TaxID=3074108 RepID=UPI00370D16BE